MKNGGGGRKGAGDGVKGVKGVDGDKGVEEGDGGKKGKVEEGKEMVVLAEDIDLAMDAPGYMVYEGGRVVRGGGMGKVL